MLSVKLLKREFMSSSSSAGASAQAASSPHRRCAHFRCGKSFFHVSVSLLSQSNVVQTQFSVLRREKKLFSKAGNRQEEFVRFMTTMMTALHLRLHFPFAAAVISGTLRCSDSSHAGWKCRKFSGFGQYVAPPAAVAPCTPSSLFHTLSGLEPLLM